MEHLNLGLRRALSALTVAGLLAGCSATSQTGTLNAGGRTIKYQAPKNYGDLRTGPVTRIFTGKCLYQGDHSALLPTLAPILLKAAVTTLGDALIKAGEERAVATYGSLAYDPAEASPTGDANDGAPSAKCIQIVHGEFARRKSDAKPDLAFAAELGGKAGNSGEVFSKNLADLGIHLVGAPAFMVELIPVASGDVRRMQPTLLSYRASIDTGKTGDRRGLFLEVGLNIPSKSFADKDSKQVLFPFGYMTSGDESIAYSADDPRLPPMLWSNVNIPGDEPLNIEARLVEVRDARPVLAAIGNLLTDNADPISAALRQDLFPTATEQSAQTTAKIKALQEYQTAVTGHRTALDGQAKALSAAAGQSAARRASIKAEQQAIVDAAALRLQLAARAAGRPATF